jgi:hypothetical protein
VPAGISNPLRWILRRKPTRARELPKTPAIPIKIDNNLCRLVIADPWIHVSRRRRALKYSAIVVAQPLPFLGSVELAWTRSDAVPTMPGVGCG